MVKVAQVENFNTTVAQHEKTGSKTVYKIMSG